MPLLTLFTHQHPHTHTLTHLTLSRSSLFLSSYISLAFGGACLGHNLTGRSTGAVLAAFTWIGGLATLLEKKSRRMELALYVMSRCGRG